MQDEKLQKAKELIDKLDLEEAQKILDETEEKSGEKYYLQSRIFAARGWLKERRIQLEYAVNADPNNGDYKAELIEARELEEKNTLTDEDYLQRAEHCLELGYVNSADDALRNVKENCGRKYFLQSRVYKAKRWYSEQRKQLKKAIKAEPQNEVYKKELEELEAFRKTKEYKKTKRQMGGVDVGGMCAEGCIECCGYLCCELICEGLGNGC